jgi:outer membrane lipoprotein-sorting protein
MAMLKIVSVLLLIGILLSVFLFMDEKVDSFNSLKSNDKIIMLQYKEISETNDTDNNISIKTSYITYLYPNKLRIETLGKNKSIEIYNRKRYIYYDITRNIIKSKAVYKKIMPSALEKSRDLDKIIKAGNYEFFGFEEKDDKRLQVIGVISATDGHQMLHKYWIEKLFNTNLIYKEEYFVDTIVESKTTYIYMKVNEQIDEAYFDFNYLP